MDDNAQQWAYQLEIENHYREYNMQEDELLKCEECEEFIPDEDFEKKEAIRYLYTPDSAYTCEVWVTLCKKCNVFENLY
jgi:hypothetical protein